jgi:hypothetical protein
MELILWRRARCACACGFSPVWWCAFASACGTMMAKTRWSRSSFTTSDQDIAHTHLGFSGSVSYPRRAFTPSKVLSDWLPSPCDAALPSPRVDVTPPSTTEPMSCCIRSPEARSAATREWGGTEHSSSHVHVLCLKQTNVGGCQAPLMQQHPRVQGALRMPEGLHLAARQRSPIDPPGYWTLMASQSLSPSWRCRGHSFALSNSPYSSSA